jgi:hypothetical protein
VTICAAGGLPIPDQPWQVPTEDGAGREPMCEVHSIAVDLGRALDQSVNIAPYRVEKVQEVLRELLDLPCPQPRPEPGEPPPVDDDAREALDRIWLKGETPSWERFVEDSEDS